MSRSVKVYIDTRMRLGLPAQPYCFIAAPWTNFFSKGCIRLLLAERSGRLIAGIVMLCFRERGSAEYAASDHSFSAKAVRKPECAVIGRTLKFYRFGSDAFRL